ncbi:MAG: 4Fe-4S dicluster domain-containing protein [Cytophagales bacterium]|nr:MAG: 4Fe-4S dicluster domain-containing protein [Cytophagales bacterium]
MSASYFRTIYVGINTVWQGMKLTMQHFKQARFMHSPTNVQSSNYFLENKGIVTLQYPIEKIPVPDHGRYQLHNEMDDCIVCDKCAVICPVDCIAIEPIKSSEAIGTTSDGSIKRLYAAKFDIDMAKCCFCGLCTSVCPTECLTMTSEYDFSTFKIVDMNFKFGNLTEEQSTEKKKLYEQFIKEKEENKLKLESEKLNILPKEEVISVVPKIGTPKIPVPNFIKSNENLSVKITENKEILENITPLIPKPAGLKPVIKPKIEPTENKEISDNIKPLIPKPAGLKPVIKPVIQPTENKEISENITPLIPKPAGLKPVIKPVIQPTENKEISENIKPLIPKPAGLKPVIKPKIEPTENKEISENINPLIPKPAGLKPVIKPIIKKPDIE